LRDTHQVQGIRDDEGTHPDAHAHHSRVSMLRPWLDKPTEAGYAFLVFLDEKKQQQLRSSSTTNTQQLTNNTTIVLF
jgi:hypothetical protein